MTAGRAVVEVLKAEGTRCVFGLPGGHVIDIYDALYDTPGIRHVLVRHEHAAACMAAGYAQLTGEPAVCLVTAGPGATNLLTGIAEASVGALPVIILAGRGPTTTVYRGASQEIATDRVFAPVTKWSVRVDRADLLTEVLRQAYTVARSGKPGPVLVDIPRDLLGQQVTFPGYVPAGPPDRMAGDPARIEAVAAALLTAERPVIVAGGGVVASGAFAELREVAELLTLPVLTSLAGRGSLPDDHPLSAGGLGAHRNPVSRGLLAEADLVLGLGTRFEEMETNWRLGFAAAALPAARVVYPDRPAVGFTGDGSFQMVMNVLPVAAEHRLGVTWCVLNDGALGSIWDIQEYRLSRRIIGTEFALQPDFAAIAHACGCYGRRVEDPAEVDAAVAEAMEANQRGVPAVLDFAVARTRLRQTREHYTYYPDLGNDAL